VDPLVTKYIAKAVATFAVCAAGVACMWITKSEVGIGWALFGVFLIWC
jgi:hypothetical protein